MRGGLKSALLRLKQQKKNMEQSRIEYFINKKTLTAKEKKEIRDAADELGIRYKVKQGCGNCYETLLLRIYEQTSKEVNRSKDGYALKKVSETFMVNGMKVGNENISEIEVGKFNKAIIARYFVKCEPEPQPEPQPEQIQEKETEVNYAENDQV